MNWNVLQTVALAVRSDGTYEPFSAEAWKYAGEMTLLGMGMVFAVLALLWGILAVFKLIFVGKSPKAPKEPWAPKTMASKTASATEKAPDDAISAVIAASIQAYQEDEARNNTALVAVLTAAVAAYRTEEGSEGGFRVVSFKRASGRAWNTRK